MPGLECFCISFHNPSCQQLPLFNQNPYCSLPSSNFQLSQVTADGRERHQLNFNFVLPLRKYTKEVALGCLANGGMTTHQLEFWSLPSSHPRWDAVGAGEGLVPRSIWWRAEKGPLAINIITCQLSPSWKKGDLNLIHMVPKNELVWVLQALWKDNETSTPKLPNRRALLQTVKLFPVTRGPDTPEFFNCRVSLQWKPWHPLYWLCCDMCF